MATSMPASCRRSTASRDSGRTASATANAASTRPVLDQVDGGSAPCAAAASAIAAARPAVRRRAARSSAGPPTCSVRPSTTACTPWPGMASKPCGRGTARPRSSALVDNAPARSGARSRARLPRPGAAPRPRSTPSSRVISTTRCSPSVSVPVLSNTTTLSDARLLEAAPVAHEQPVPRAERGGDRDDERDGEPERVRAGDHEHRHDPLDREARGASEQRARRWPSAPRRRWRRA